LKGGGLRRTGEGKRARQDGQGFSPYDRIYAPKWDVVGVRGEGSKEGSGTRKVSRRQKACYRLSSVLRLIVTEKNENAEKDRGRRKSRKKEGSGRTEIQYPLNGAQVFDGKFDPEGGGGGGSYSSLKSICKWNFDKTTRRRFYSR